jgi:hypothetical protein
MVHNLSDVHQLVRNLHDNVQVIQVESNSNRYKLADAMNTNQNEIRSILQKCNKEHIEQNDHLELKLNALFALGVTLGVVWLYYKWKSSGKQPILLDCNSLDKPAKEEEKRPPMYPNLLYPILSEEIKSNRSDNMEQLVAIESEKTKSLKECQDFLRRAKEIESSKRTIVAYIDSNKPKQGYYTPYGL